MYSITELNSMFPDVRQNLEVLAEECAEVIVQKSKCVRFGLDNYNPETRLSNNYLLDGEIGDLLAMVDILVANGVLNPKNIDFAKQEKWKKLNKWYTLDDSKD